MELIEQQGNLFDADYCYVLAHCISCDVTAKIGMGKGIAKTFRDTYPAMAGEIASQLRIGKTIRYTFQKEVIYNLVTKNYYYQKATSNYRSAYYKNIDSALINLRDQMVEYNEHFLALPRIGCGLDGCSWNEIKTMIQKVFADTDIHIIVWYLE